MMQARGLCQDQPQAAIQGIISEQLFGRVISNGNLDQGVDELRHGCVLVGRSVRLGFDLLGASHRIGMIASQE
jgi:hypothetical protein